VRQERREALEFSAAHLHHGDALAVLAPVRDAGQELALQVIEGVLDVTLAECQGGGVARGQVLGVLPALPADHLYLLAFLVSILFFIFK